MSIKVGDKVTIRDVSWSFGIYKGHYSDEIPDKYEDDEISMTVMAVGLEAIRDLSLDQGGEYSAVNDLLVTDGDDNYWFTQSQFVRKIYEEKNITVKYLCNGEDVTDKISTQTKRNLVP